MTYHVGETDALLVSGALFLANFSHCLTMEKEDEELEVAPSFVVKQMREKQHNGMKGCVC